MESKSNIVALLCATVALPIAIAGCAGSNSDQPSAMNGEKFYAVITDSAAFYRYGPQQGNGPDKQLQKDTLMTLIRRSFGYCKVKLATGEQGYVATEDIDVAPPALVAAVTTPPTPPTGSRHFRFDPNDPRFAPPPEGNPEFEPTPIPGSSPSGY
jgi:hypothetical protein